MTKLQQLKRALPEKDFKFLIDLALTVAKTGGRIKFIYYPLYGMESETLWVDKKAEVA